MIIKQKEALLTTPICSLKFRLSSSRRLRIRGSVSVMGGWIRRGKSYFTLPWTHTTTSMRLTPIHSSPPWGRRSELDIKRDLIVLIAIVKHYNAAHPMKLKWSPPMMRQWRRNPKLINMSAADSRPPLLRERVNLSEWSKEIVFLREEIDTQL